MKTPLDAAMARIAALEALVVDLAAALEQHARTDCAPDEALPFMRKLKSRAKKLARRTP